MDRLHALERAATDGDEQAVLALLASADIESDERPQKGATPARRILDCTVSVRADLLWPSRRPLCALWLGPGGGLFALPAGERAFDLVQAPSRQVMQALARALDVAPRRAAAQHARIATSRERLHRLLDLGAGADSADVAQALELTALAPQDAAALIELAGAGRAHWRVEVRWGSDSRRLHAVDCEQAPLWLLGEWPGDLLVGGPSTLEALERSLAALLPAGEGILAST